MIFADISHSSAKDTLDMLNCIRKTHLPLKIRQGLADCAYNTFYLHHAVSKKTIQTVTLFLYRVWYRSGPYYVDTNIIES